MDSLPPAVPGISYIILIPSFFSFILILVSFCLAKSLTHYFFFCFFCFHSIFLTRVTRVTPQRISKLILKVCKFWSSLRSPWGQTAGLPSYFLLPLQGSKGRCPCTIPLSPVEWDEAEREPSVRGHEMGQCRGGCWGKRHNMAHGDLGNVEEEREKESKGFLSISGVALWSGCYCFTQRYLI